MLCLAAIISGQKIYWKRSGRKTRTYTPRNLLKSCANVLTQFNYLRVRPNLKGRFGHCHKEVNKRHENEVAHFRQANEEVSTWTHSVQ